MIKLVIFDFDGVFTDGKIIFDSNGNAMKHYHAKDGMGIFRLHDAGFEIGVISGWPNNVSQHAVLKHLKITRVSLGSNGKLEILKKWCDELEITLNEVAYMGDDLNDVKVMKEVGFVACPNDSVDEVKEIADLVCEKCGGKCAVREFCEYLIEIKKRHNLKITAVIPCRKGSTRCKNKNMRKWGNTNLLQNKIDILKKCKNIDNILVNTNDDEAIEVAEKNNILFFKRDDKLCIGNIEHSKFIYNLVSNIPNEIFLYSSPVAPFVSPDTIDNLIDFWRNHPNYSIVSASTSIKNFIWQNNKPYNFDISQGLPSTQSLDSKYQYSAADSALIGYKNYVMDKKCIFGDGNSVFMFEINELESIDIDWNLDFVISECLLHRCFKNIELVENYMKNNSFKKTKLLDCTLRDTGFLNNWNWDYKTIVDFVHYMGLIGTEYCEIGFIMNEEEVDKDSGICRNIARDFSIVRRIKKDSKCKTKISVLYDLQCNKVFDIDDIPSQEETDIDLVRICSNYEILEKSLEYITKLKEKGYNITLNISYSSQISDIELEKILIFVKELPIDYLYLADSMGSLTPREINELMTKLKKIYPIKIGFHNHNNHGTVFGNIINLLNCNIDILDGTISGFGKNGGNANLEQLIMYLCLKEKYNLKIESLLEFLEKIKNIKFGKFKLDLNSIKKMLQQFMNIHYSHLEPIINDDVLTIYKKLKKIDSGKKIF